MKFDPRPTGSGTGRLSVTELLRYALRTVFCEVMLPSFLPDFLPCSPWINGKEWGSEKGNSQVLTTLV